MKVSIKHTPKTEHIEVEKRSWLDGYTSCIVCDWFGIPIMDGGAPDKCNDCLVKEYEALSKEGADTSIIWEVVDELDYFFSRQNNLNPLQRRCKPMEAVKQ